MHAGADRARAETAAEKASQRPGVPPQQVQRALPAFLPVESGTQSNVINDEYKLWKKASSLLYDYLLTYPTAHPLQSVEWLPYKQRDEEGKFSFFRLHSGTVTPPGVQDLVSTLEVALPDVDTEVEAEVFATYGAVGGLGLPLSAPRQRICKPIQFVRHEGPVLRLAVSPHNPHIAAAKGVGSLVHVYEKSNFVDLQRPSDSGDGAASCVLKNPNEHPIVNGRVSRGLEWAPNNPGVLLAAGSCVGLWDVPRQHSLQLQRPNKDGVSQSPQPVGLPHTQRGGEGGATSSSASSSSSPMTFGLKGKEGVLPIQPLCLYGNKIAMYRQKQKKEKEKEKSEPVTAEKDQEGEAEKEPPASGQGLQAQGGRSKGSKGGSASGGQDKILEVAWHGSEPGVFASLGADRVVSFWDVRLPIQQKPVAAILAGRSMQTSLAFPPGSSNPYLSVTGAEDGEVRFWDSRFLRHEFHSCRGHAAAVNRCRFSPINPSILASCGDDRRVQVIDLSKIDSEREPRPRTDVHELDAEPEVLFTHAGHTAGVLDISWCPSEDNQWTLASVGADNILQIWAMSEHIYWLSSSIDSLVPSVRPDTQPGASSSSPPAGKGGGEGGGGGSAGFQGGPFPLKTVQISEKVKREPDGEVVSGSGAASSSSATSLPPGPAASHSQTGNVGPAVGIGFQTASADPSNPLPSAKGPPPHTIQELSAVQVPFSTPPNKPP
uniref:Histone-binding protein RBBP4-like N-terminal domain-containing protein n=1 Tax=Chromera velia CCMP2878 TaxID=1169474 RepID=A0A0G4H3K1_9ALVE|eukprot:Cvel_24562.t1-p1 / transcript=Cvel_24562.t1 / gene=Cvel_24562 / organism=Chromera_velia_CCMP2878 / gene_product=Histone-binding protein MSI1 homolog, putative / transcript_product=Histone-binding protein MSI1 homolog, putative / location=Cvel_scaffold2671:8359-15856(+) / protein_length=714 / sequence_SO=supercontig / SO=protein_coding / is_pseudo=false